MYLEPSALTIPIAFIAGLFSYVSPCVLPLVPAYIGYLTGHAANIAGAAPENEKTLSRPSRWYVTLHGLFFVIGFALFFALLGIGAGALGQLSLRLNIASTWIARAGGVIVIMLGLHVMGVIRIPFLYVDTRRQSAPKPGAGYLGSFLMGITFSAGWSPCIGPILAGMLTLGLSTASVGRAVILLLFYALGLGIPFILTAFLLDRVAGLFARIQKHMRAIELVSGALLILIGLFILTGSMAQTSLSLGGGDLSIRLEDWLISVVGGE